MLTYISAPKRSRSLARAGCVALVVGAGLLVLLTVQRAARAQAPAEAAPIYRLTARVDLQAHTIQGELELELEPGDPRIGGDLWFHLPPNRFMEEDPRGRRRDTDSLPFATSFRQTDTLFDPRWPAGFSEGHIAIEHVETGTGAALPFELTDNPAIPQGFSVHNGLMHVRLGAASSARHFRIAFTTHLPRRYWDGWSEAGMLLEQWYPLLANRSGGQWDFDMFDPRPGRYAARLTVAEGGQLFLGHGYSWQLEPGQTAEMALDPHPLRMLPLVFMRSQPEVVRHAYDLSLYSYYQSSHTRLGHLAVQIAEDFRRYVYRQYGLPPPDTRIAMVEVNVPTGDIRTVGSLILIPQDYFQNSPLLDRVFLAQLSRAVAQVWFGEAVWSNRDTQSWLQLGLSGYLALDYFHSLYGWNAGIHNLMDWLQPKYREHFFEAPLRELIRAGEDAPLMISLRHYPLQRTALLVTHNKAPIVLRSLDYVMGRQAFARALNALYFRHRYTAVTAETLREEMTEASGMDLRPFFREWFYGTPHINFAIDSWEQQATPVGYEVHVRVQRTPLPELPVLVRVTTKDGQTFDQRWEGDGAAAELTFLLPGPAASIAIDPEEHWLELNRKDNRTDVLYRVRPIFDWSKQREFLVTLHGTAGGNSTDGNYVGLGVRLTLNENNKLTAIPIYGSRTGLRNYQAVWTWQDFLAPRLDLLVKAQELGGTRLQGVGLQYIPVETDRHDLRALVQLNAETVGAASYLDFNGALVAQPKSRVNNIETELEFRRKPGLHYSNDLLLTMVDSRPGYESDYLFTTYRADVSQTLALGSAHLLTLQLTRGITEGTPPVQLRHELGGPELMRGYPRVVLLANDQVAAAKLDYGYVLTRRLIGTTAQIRQITLYLFGDMGRGWNNGERYDQRPRRQDAGLGVELEINLLRLIEFPIRVDVAYPLNDDQYRGAQVILFGLLNF